MRRGLSGMRRSLRSAAGLAAMMSAPAIVATACTPTVAPAPTPPPAEGHIGVRQVELHLSGAVTYDVGAEALSGRVVTTWNGNPVETMNGTVGFAGSGGPATATFALTRNGGLYDGSISIADPGAGVATTVNLSSTGVTFDGDGDGAGVVTDGATQLRWRVDTLIADGREPTLDQLTALEGQLCVDAQRTLVGVDSVALPTIVTTNHNDRDAFVSSKVTHGPLSVHEWTGPDMVTTASGKTVALSHRVSCKTASSDRLAALGVATSPDLQCSVLTTASIALARTKMTPAELAAYDTGGRQIVLKPDFVGAAGPVWLGLFTDEVVNGSTLEVTSNSLQVNWTDPAYFALPESFRGVHYCTFWSPAWAYWWMTEGAFAP